MVCSGQFCCLNNQYQCFNGICCNQWLFIHMCFIEFFHYNFELYLNIDYYKLECPPLSLYVFDWSTNCSIIQIRPLQQVDV